MMPFLELADLRTHFPVEKGLLFQRLLGTVKAVDGVSLRVEKGETLGLVGESGCGKSTLGRTIIQMIRPTSGTVSLDGVDLATLNRKKLRAARANFQMIFQDPYATLNPRMTVFDTLSEAVRAHRQVPDITVEVSEILRHVGLASHSFGKYPHEFSGGQRQRIAIARALAVRPKLIIADEPVSALDVSIQAQILNLLSQIRREMDLTMIFISHDLSVVKHISDRIAVMYLGRIVETGMADEVVERPLHPYTKALVSAVPIPDPVREKTRRRITLQGDPPSPINPPAGCPFHPRCAYAIPQCAMQVPSLEEFSPNRTIACIRAGEIN